MRCLIRFTEQNQVAAGKVAEQRQAIASDFSPRSRYPKEVSSRGATGGGERACHLSPLRGFNVCPPSYLGLKSEAITCRRSATELAMSLT